jgi:hypothetical protein
MRAAFQVSVNQPRESPKRCVGQDDDTGQRGLFDLHEKGPVDSVLDALMPSATARPTSYVRLRRNARRLSGLTAITLPASRNPTPRDRASSAYKRGQGPWNAVRTAPELGGDRSGFNDRGRADQQDAKPAMPRLVLKRHRHVQKSPATRPPPVPESVANRVFTSFVPSISVITSIGPCVCSAIRRAGRPFMMRTHDGVVILRRAAGQPFFHQIPFRPQSGLRHRGPAHTATEAAVLATIHDGRRAVRVAVAKVRRMGMGNPFREYPVNLRRRLGRLWSQVKRLCPLGLRSLTRI